MKRSGYMRKGLIARTALALALAGISGGIALAQQATTTQLAQADKISTEDQEFLTRAIQAGVAEVQISQLALEIAERASPSVR
jgi:predicted outer membrane protein